MYNPIKEKRRLVKERIAKSFDSGINVNDEADIEKARQGVYADNPMNRKLMRVGQQYGQASTSSSTTKPEVRQAAKKELKKRNDNILTITNPDYCGRKYVVKTKSGEDIDVYMYSNGENSGQANTIHIGVNNDTAKVFGFTNSIKFAHAILDFITEEKIKKDDIKIHDTKLSSASNITISSFSVSKMRRMFKYFNAKRNVYNSLTHNNENNVSSYINLAMLFKNTSHNVKNHV